MNAYTWQRGRPTALIHLVTAAARTRYAAIRRLRCPDGRRGMTQEQVNRVPDHRGPGSQPERRELPDGPAPSDINERIQEFLAA